MRTSTWDRERFGTILDTIGKRAGLKQPELAVLAGRSRSQFNRWTRAENQPTYLAVSRLASAVAARYPELAELTEQLVDAAGYGPSNMLSEPGPDMSDAIEAKAAVHPEPTPERAQPLQRSTEDIRAEIAEIMSRMTPEEIERFERDIAEEEAELARVIMQRRLRWARLMRGESVIPD